MIHHHPLCRLIPKWIVVVGVGVLFWIGVGPCRMAEAETLTQAFFLAYHTNPNLRAARSALHASDSEIDVARSGDHPRVFLTGSIGRSRWGVTSNLFHLTNASLAANENAYGLEIEQPIWQGGHTRASIRKAQNGVSARLAAMRETEQHTFLAVAEIYSSVYRSQAVLRLEQNNERLLRQHLESTKARLRNGEATRTDLAEARARLDQAEAAVIAASGQLANVESVFTEIVGSPPGTLARPLPIRPLPHSLAETRALASENFSVLVARYGIRSARATISEVRSASLPSVQLVGEYLRSYNPEFGFTRLNTAALLVNVTVPIYTGGVTSARTRVARDRLREQQAQARVALRAALAEATQAWQNYVTSKAQIRALRAQVAAEQIAYRGLVAEHRQGVKTLLNVLNAEHELLASRVALVSATVARIVAGYAIRAAVGELTWRQLRTHRRISRIPPVANP
ncbi:MAG: TolC family outer membrane protein [Gammaproteobacteria bacterium]